MQIPILKQGNILIVSIQMLISDQDLITLKGNLLHKVGMYRTKGVVIDVTTLDVMDSFSTRTLKKSGEIKCSLYKLENNVVLITSDNGNGIPPQIDIKNTVSLGMRLIYSLTKQLAGTILLDSTQGTQYTLTFLFDK